MPGGVASTPVDTWRVQERYSEIATTPAAPLFGIPLGDHAPALMRDTKQPDLADADARPSTHNPRSERFPHQQVMEERFGEDFSGVEVELGAALSGLGAEGTAEGKRVRLSTTAPSQELVAHELVHVLQHERHGPGHPGISTPEDEAEREADGIAQVVAAGGRAPAVTRPAGVDDPRIPPDSSASASEDEIAADSTLASQAPAETQAEPETQSDAAAEPGMEEPRVGTEEVADSETPNAAASEEVAGATHDASQEPTSALDDAAVPDASASDDPFAVLEQPAGLATLRGATASELGSALAEGLAQTTRDLSSVASAVARPRSVASNTRLRADRSARSEPDGTAPPDSDPLSRSERAVLRVDHPAGRDGHAAREADKRRSGRHSAGARPRVPMSGAAEPGVIAADRDARADVADARRSRADAVASAPVPATPRPGVAQGETGPVERARPDVPAVEIADPFGALPDEDRDLLDRVAADAITQRTDAIAQSAQIISEDTAARARELEADAEAQREQQFTAARAQQAAAQRDASARIHATQSMWKADNSRIRQEFEARSAQKQAAAEAEVQAEVQAGELRADALLTEAEGRADATERAAQIRADAILADAEQRAAAANASTSADAIMRRVDDGAGEAAAGSQILDDAREHARNELLAAQEEIAQLLADAAELTEDEIRQRIDAIEQRIADLRTELDQEVQAGMPDAFDALERLYTTQIDVLLEELEGALATLETDLTSGEGTIDCAYVASLNQLFEFNRERLDDTLTDYDVVRSFSDVDEALTAFGIDMTVENASVEWTDRQRQMAFGAAVRMENAWRELDPELFDSAGLAEPGALFDAIMAPGVDEDGENNQLELKRMVDGDGAETFDNRIEFGSVTGDDTDEWIASGTLLHFLHEYHHAFNANLVGASNDLYGVPDLAPYSGSEGSGPGVLQNTELTTQAGNEIGIGPTRYVPSEAELDARTEWGPDRIRWPAYQEYAEGQGGLRISSNTGYASLPDGTGLPGVGYPYQQNLDPTYAEWYADAGANWANGTLADNAAGQRLDAFLDQQTLEWLTMSLASQGLLPDE